MLTSLWEEEFLPGKKAIEVNGKTLTFAKAVIATGGTAAIPNIPGLADAPLSHQQLDL